MSCDTEIERAEAMKKSVKNVILGLGVVVSFSTVLFACSLHPNSAEDKQRIAINNAVEQVVNETNSLATEVSIRPVARPINTAEIVAKASATQTP